MGQTITAKMSFVQVMEVCPESVEIFKQYDLDCFDCQMAEYENLEQGCRIHGVDLKALLDALNRAIG